MHSIQVVQVIQVIQVMQIIQIIKVMKVLQVILEMQVSQVSKILGGPQPGLPRGSEEELLQLQAVNDHLPLPVGPSVAKGGGNPRSS